MAVASYLTEQRHHVPIHCRQQLVVPTRLIVVLWMRWIGQRHNVIVIDVHAAGRFALVPVSRARRMHYAASNATRTQTADAASRPFAHVRGATGRSQCARSSVGRKGSLYVDISPLFVMGRFSHCCLVSLISVRMVQDGHSKRLVTSLNFVRQIRTIRSDEIYSIVHWSATMQFEFKLIVGNRMISSINVSSHWGKCCVLALFKLAVFYVISNVKVNAA